MQNRPPVPPKKPVPTWLIVMGVMFALAFMIGQTGNRLREKEASQPKVVEAPKPKPTKSVGERVFRSSLVGYTEQDGRILVAYIMTEAERRSIHTEIKRFMRELTSDKAKQWSSVTISAHGYVRDQYGKETTQPAYTITFDRDEAAKVESWPYADIERIGRVEFANATLR